MPVFLALPNSAAFPSRAARNTGTESFYLTSIRWGEKGDERTFARATKRKRKGGEGRDERKKKENRQRTGVGGACANMHRRVFSHGVAPRRQASSVARRAPSHSHVTLHWAARAHAVRVVARSCLDNSPDLFFFFYSARRYNALRNCIKKKKSRDQSSNRNARENFGSYNCKIIIE